MNHPFPHQYIAIEGNIGAGKTTLCRMLEQDYQCRLILEEFSDNPFLPHFYDNPERYAFPVELFFMTERHKQLQQLAQQDLFQQLIVSDYFFIKTLLFARNNLNAEEYRLFQRLFHILNATFPKPDLLVYLHRSVPDLLTNIHNRGRSYEQDIQAEYLESLQQAYFNFFRSSPEQPILILEVEQVSFWKNESAYNRIKELIAKTYPPGIHRIAVDTKVLPKN